MVSLVTVLATQADGRTLVHDWLYELRLFALEQLSAMRADLFLCDPHRIIVSGPSRLRGRALDSRDIRSGMALIAAALAAEGESRVSPLETVERGYASLIERLTILGSRRWSGWHPVAVARHFSAASSPFSAASSRPHDRRPVSLGAAGW